MKRLSFLLALTCGLTNFAVAETPAKTFTAGPFTFSVGKGWAKKAQPRPMSKGGLTYTIEGGQDTLDADFYHFGEGQGGSVEANIQRWRGQFQGEPVEKTRSKLSDDKVELLHLEGTFLSGPPFGKKTPLKDHAMLGAILPHAEGTVFVKLTGPKADVAKVLESFKALVISPFAKKED